MIILSHARQEIVRFSTFRSPIDILISQLRSFSPETYAILRNTISRKICLDADAEL